MIEKTILLMLNRADDRVKKLVYEYTKALLEEKVPYFTIGDTEFCLGEKAIKYTTDEELEQLRALSKKIRQRWEAENTK